MNSPVPQPGSSTVSIGLGDRGLNSQSTIMSTVSCGVGTKPFIEGFSPFYGFLVESDLFTMISCIRIKLQPRNCFTSAEESGILRAASHRFVNVHSFRMLVPVPVLVHGLRRDWGVLERRNRKRGEGQEEGKEAGFWGRRLSRNAFPVITQRPRSSYGPGIRTAAGPLYATSFRTSIPPMQ